MVQKIGLFNRHVRSALSFVVALSLIGLVTYLGVNTYQASHAAFGPSMYITPAAATLANGSTLSVTIREQSGDEQVNSVQASMSYDASSLQFVGVVEGGIFPIASVTNTSTPGTVQVARANSDAAIRGDKPVVTLNFKVIGASGTSTINIDKASSFLRRSFDGRDILQTIGGGSYNLIPISPDQRTTAAPTLYINPSGGSYAAGATITAAVRMNSHSTSVTTVEAAISYPKTRLQYIGVSESGTFTIKQRTQDTGGAVDIIRAVPIGSGGVQGDNPVIKVMFKALSTSGAASLDITSASAAFDNSGSGTNILDLEGSASAVYIISSSPTNLLGSDSTITSPSQVFTVKSKGTSGRVALVTNADVSTLVEVGGLVVLTPIIDQSLVKDENDKVSKVEYYLDNILISRQLTAPYSFKFDSNNMHNGTYNLTVKTYYHSGNTGSRSDKLLVKNKITLAYVLHHYVGHIVGLIVFIAALVIVIVKVVMPRLDGDSDGQTPDDSPLYGFEAGKVLSTLPHEPTNVTAVTSISTIAQPTAPVGIETKRSVDGIVRPSMSENMPKR